MKSVKQSIHQMGDFIETEKDVSACLLLGQLLRASGFDLHSYFFTGMDTIRLGFISLST